MGNHNRFLAMLARMALLATVAYSAEAATIHLQSTGEALRQSWVRVDGNFAGFIGDLIDLHNGTYSISVNGPREYTFQFTLTVQGNALNIGNIKHIPGECAERFEVNWRRPDIVDSTEYKAVKALVLSDPKFGGSLGFVCAMGAMASCPERVVILEAKTDPRGAEIWIDGIRAPIPTNTTLSVPYCEDESSKEVMFRMDGKINCKQTIQLSPDDRVSVSCAFNQPNRIN